MSGTVVLICPPGELQSVIVDVVLTFLGVVEVYYVSDLDLNVLESEPEQPSLLVLQPPARVMSTLAIRDSLSIVALEVSPSVALRLDDTWLVVPPTEVDGPTTVRGHATMQSILSSFDREARIRATDDTSEALFDAVVRACDVALERLQGDRADRDDLLSAVAAAWSARGIDERTRTPMPAGWDKIATDALAPFEPSEKRGEGPRWDWSLFYENDRLAPMRKPSVDVTGPARCVIYGPYMRLPAGHWRCEMTFDLEGETTPGLMSVDVYTDRQEALFVFEVADEGHFTVTFDIEITSPIKDIQCRLFVNEGQIEGIVKLHGLKLEQAESLEA